MPLVVLEAWAAGIPVIASRVGGLAEMIDQGRTGLLFPFEDEAALVAGLRGLLVDREAARRIGQAGQARAESFFDIRQTAETYHHYYVELLARLTNPTRKRGSFAGASGS
jgi:starch synthase